VWYALSFYITQLFFVLYDIHPSVFNNFHSVTEYSREKKYYWVLRIWDQVVLWRKELHQVIN